MNKVLLSGRLTRDPEVRIASNDMKIARYTLAVDGRGKDDVAEFIYCICFGKRAEFAESWLYKGMKIIVEGRLHVNKWEKEDGTTASITEVIVDSHEFCESRKNNDEKHETASGGEKFYTEDVDVDEEDLPF